jgi:hypothetical protein
MLAAQNRHRRRRGAAERTLEDVGRGLTAGGSDGYDVAGGWG